MESKRVQFLRQLEAIQEIPSLPLIVMKVNEMLDDRTTTMDELTRVIENDQAIVFKMLMLVNSAFFGLREKVSSVKEAVIILGFDAIRNIIISLTTFDTLNDFAQNQDDSEINLDDFWRHSIAVAVLSKHISRKMHLGDPDKCFVNGLLHDIGKLVLAFYFKDRFKTAVQSARSEGGIYITAEKKTLPATHCDIGYYVARKWDLPRSITDVIYHHHRIGPACPSKEEVIIANTADGLVNSFIRDTLNSTPTSGRLVDNYFDDESKKRMKPLIHEADRWFPRQLDVIREAQAFFFN